MAVPSHGCPGQTLVFCRTFQLAQISEYNSGIVSLISLNYIIIMRANDNFVWAKQRFVPLVAVLSYVFYVEALRCFFSVMQYNTNGNHYAL